MRGASRYREEQCRYSITCTSSVSPAANDLNDRPCRLFGSDHFLELWPELRKSPIFTKFQWSPVIHTPTSSSLNWSRHLSYRPYIRRYTNTLQRYSNRQTRQLWMGCSSCTFGGVTLISIIGIVLNTLPDTTSSASLVASQRRKVSICT